MKVVAYKNLPTRDPLQLGAIAWLLLDRFRAPGWLWGAVITVFAVVVIGTVIRFFQQTTVDLFEESAPAEPGK